MVLPQLLEKSQLENLGLHRGPAEHLLQSRCSFSVNQY